MSLIVQAQTLALIAHAGQAYGTKPFIEHPKDVARRAREYGFAEHVIAAAWLHDVLEDIPNPPSYSAVRATLNILKEKGLLKHNRQGKKYIYSPTIFIRKSRSAPLTQSGGHFNSISATLLLHNNLLVHFR